MVALAFIDHADIHVVKIVGYIHVHVRIAYMHVYLRPDEGVWSCCRQPISSGCQWKHSPTAKVQRSIMYFCKRNFLVKVVN